MKDSLAEYEKEFEELVGGISETTSQMNDAFAIGSMLYKIAQEKASTNLLIKDINAKFDLLMNKMEKLESDINNLKTESIVEPEANLSDRDNEVIEFIKNAGKVDAKTLQEKYDYKGRNAASARLSKLFKEGHLDKTYAGRKVYYKLRG